MSRQEKINALIIAAQECARADKKLGDSCHKSGADPIACTVNAYKRGYSPLHQQESISVAIGIGKVMQLHLELVAEYGMDFDEVGKIWLDAMKKTE